jgi:hypothetical protein
LLARHCASTFVRPSTCRSTRTKSFSALRHSV